MKIVDVCAFYTPHGGGVRTYAEQKLRIGAQSGHDITILAPGDRHEVIERGPAARIVTIPSPRFPLDRKYWYFDDEPALHAALDALEPDFVEASSPWRSAAMVGRWNRDVPRSLVMHADPLSAYAYRWFGAFLSRPHIDRRFAWYWEHLRRLGQVFDTTICANADLARRLQAGGVGGVTVQPLGVETKIFRPERRDPAVRELLLAQCGLNPDATLLVAAGRLAPEKRWPMIVEAVATASRRAPVGLALFGDGRERQAVLRAIGGNPHIRLFEPERNRETFAAIVASADAVLHGCEAETFCMVAAEARASGTPVIVPDSGGASDHAANGAGLTYRAASRVAAAEAVSAFCAQPLTRLSTGAVISHEEHFDRLFRHYTDLGRKALAA
jgi:alpha-1,6-mannosyltransferase